jgi:hypothetical protein
MSDWATLREKIVFDDDEEAAIKIVNAATFDLNEVDDEGSNVADMAEMQGFNDLLKLLESKGIKPNDPFGYDIN